MLVHINTFILYCDKEKNVRGMTTTYYMYMQHKKINDPHHKYESNLQVT